MDNLHEVELKIKAYAQEDKCGNWWITFEVTQPYPINSSKPISIYLDTEVITGFSYTGDVMDNLEKFLTVETKKLWEKFIDRYRTI